MTWAKQSIIVSKERAARRAAAMEIAREYADKALYTSRETKSSWRFRQAPPEKFDRFRTAAVGRGVSIVYGAAGGKSGGGSGSRAGSHRGH